MTAISTERLKKILPKPVYNFGRTVLLQRYRIDKGVRHSLAYSLYRSGLASFERLYPERYYHKRTVGEKKRNAEEFSETLQEEFSPDSVVDFGCGVGQHLKPLHEDGVRVYGIDGHGSAKEQSVIPEDCFEVADLTEKESVPEGFDVALCLEVLEHIPEEYADHVVKLIVRSADLILVSAAVPGQGGFHHVNEQPHDYWLRKFMEQGAEYREEKTRYFKRQLDVGNDPRKENLLIFSTGGRS